MLQCSSLCVQYPGILHWVKLMTVAVLISAIQQQTAPYVLDPYKYLKSKSLLFYYIPVVDYLFTS